MRGKKLIRVLLLAFVSAGLGMLLFKGLLRGTEAGSTPSDTAGTSSVVAVPGGALGQGGLTGPATQVVAYYFHGKFRCASCLAIERLSGKAIREGFPEDLRSGRLEFREVNVDLPENRHFVEDYQLSSQSLVLVQYRDGRQVRWKNLEKVWILLGSEKAFLSYVRYGVSAYLTGA